jgi:hypothetical protein
MLINVDIEYPQNHPVESNTLKVQCAYKERSNLPYVPLEVEYQR